MSDPAVLVAVREKLEGIAGLPNIVWPNQAITVSAPYLIFDNGIQAGSIISIDGQEAFDLRPQVSLMVEADTYTSAGDAVLWSIAQAFKAGTKIRNDAGDIIASCQQTPVPDNGAPDNGGFRRNMILRIASYQQI